MKTPKAYIMAGANGSGKTTFAREFLPRYAKCQEFLNADFMAQGLSTFAPEKAAFSASRLMLERMDELILRQVDFGFETTLTGKAYVDTFKRMRAKGYQIHLCFMDSKCGNVYEKKFEQNASPCCESGGRSK
jgi:predicted ABC-type ATPase